MDIIRNDLESGAPFFRIMQNWQALQIYCALYINSEQAGLQIPGVRDRPFFLPFFLFILPPLDYWKVNTWVLSKIKGKTGTV